MIQKVECFAVCIFSVGKSHVHPSCDVKVAGHAACRPYLVISNSFEAEMGSPVQPSTGCLDIPCLFLPLLLFWNNYANLSAPSVTTYGLHPWSLTRRSSGSNWNFFTLFRNPVIFEWFFETAILLIYSSSVHISLLYLCRARHLLEGFKKARCWHLDG